MESWLIRHLLRPPRRADLQLPASAATAVAPLLVRMFWLQPPSQSPVPVPPPLRSRHAATQQSPPQTHSRQGKNHIAAPFSKGYSLKYSKFHAEI